jgi:hypothetical protein
MHHHLDDGWRILGNDGQCLASCEREAVAFIDLIH